MAGLSSSSCLIGSSSATAEWPESLAFSRPPMPPKASSIRRNVGCYCVLRNEGIRAQITSSFPNKVFEDRVKGIVCYRDGNGEVVCEGFDEGPRPVAPCPSSNTRDEDVEVIELLERSWLRLAARDICKAGFRVQGFLN